MVVVFGWGGGGGCGVAVGGGGGGVGLVGGGGGGGGVVKQEFRVEHFFGRVVQLRSSICSHSDTDAIELACRQVRGMNRGSSVGSQVAAGPAQCWRRTGSMENNPSSYATYTMLHWGLWPGGEFLLY